MIRFRKTVEDDAAILATWIAQDPYHRHIEPLFFMERTPGVSCYVVEDQAGPVMFVRQETEGENIRLHVQFPMGRRRVREAVREAYPLWANDAKARGFRQIRFELESSALIKLMLGFGYRAELVTDL
jgi:hypothetical protein